MPTHNKRNKGKLVADENADRNYIRIAREEGWEIITIPPSFKNIGFTDPQVATRYTKGLYSLFTGDRTAYKQNPKEKGAVGFIIHKTVKKEEGVLYETSIRHFFKTHSAKSVRNVIWIIESDGNPKKIKIEE